MRAWAVVVILVVGCGSKSEERPPPVSAKGMEEVRHEYAAEFERQAVEQGGVVVVRAMGEGSRTLRFTARACSQRVLDEGFLRYVADMRELGFVRAECHDGDRVVAAADL